MQNFDLVIYCPLELEFDQVCKIFGYDEDFTDQFGFLSLRTSLENLTILIVAGEEMGVQSAQTIASQIDQKCKFELFVCLGIAGSISDDVNLCDVVYSGKVFDLTSNQKVSDASTDFSPTPYKTPSKFTTTLNYLRKHPILSELKDRWETECSEYIKQVDNEKGVISDLVKIPVSHSGTIVTGPVTAGKDYKSKILKVDRKTLAVETEVGGIFSHFERNDFHNVITIRGISDAADEKKTKLENETSGNVRSIAARNAALFLYHNLKGNSFFRQKLSVDSETPLLEGLETKSVAQDDIVSSAHRRATKAIIASLKRDSLEYKNLNSDSWVPAPRLLPTENYEAEHVPRYIEDNLTEYSHVSIEIPFGYPDNGTPSLFALQLLSTTINEKTLIPVFIDTKKLAPPRSINFFAKDFSETELNELESRDDCAIVYVLDRIPINSDSKIDHLVHELNQRIGTFSIGFINYQTSQDLVQHGVPDFFSRFTIEAISFSSIAKFIRKNFELEFVEAENVALKLSQTFEEFDLPAHPGYFAGIPKEFLFKLLEANRRSELIDLAVTGFLTFAVIEDKGEVRLSRTMRKHFLKKLLFEMEIRGKSFNRNDVVLLAEKTLKDHDFDVSANSFVDQFLELGLLSENGTQIEFSIPFIKSFLLAEILAEDPILSEKYFYFESDDFDFATFSLFCEINGGNYLCSKIVETLKDDIVKFHSIIGVNANENERHALVDSNISPSVLRNTSAIVGLKQRLVERSEKVLESEDEAEKKQQILDLNSKAKASLHQKRKEVKERVSYSGASKILRDLKLGRTLLGAGAESLLAKDKQHLAKLIIELISLVIDDWYRLIQAEDHKAIKTDLVKDIKEYLEEKSELVNEKEISSFVDVFVDLHELNSFMRVIPSLMRPLHDCASQPILYKSLDEITLNDDVLLILQSLWMTTINAGKASKKFKRSVKKLPPRAFTRFSISQFIISQAYWCSSSEDERLEYLSLAETSLEPIGIELKK